MLSNGSETFLSAIHLLLKPVPPGTVRAAGTELTVSALADAGCAEPQALAHEGQDTGIRKALTDRQTDGRTDGQTEDRQTDRQTDKQTERQTGRRAEKQTDRQKQTERHRDRRRGQAAKQTSRGT